MGCLLSSPYSPFFYAFRGKAPSNSDVKLDEPKVYSWDVRPKLDPKDYSIENRNGETIVKLPGSINGMQFIIQNLENCNIYLFDHISQVSIDDCKNCRIFIGPCKGSLFIRDCIDCNLAVMCQQFRSRDCKKINTFLFCATQPIIESSTYMKFGCISVNYTNIDELLKSANLTIFNNNWNNIHDFTPIPGEPNYNLLNKDFQMESFIPLPPVNLCNQLDVTFNKIDSIIPYTTGVAFRPSNEPCLIVLFRKDLSEAAAFKQESNAKSLLSTIIRNHANLTVVQTKQYILSELSAENVFGSKKYNNFLDKKPIIGIELNGQDCHSKCQSLIESLNIELYFLSQYTSSLSHQIDNFYNFADIQMAV